MKYTFEPYREDGSPRKWVGTFRPPYSEVLEEIKNSGQIYRYMNGYEINIPYDKGTFDKPLYEITREENKAHFKKVCEWIANGHGMGTGKTYKEAYYTVCKEAQLALERPRTKE